MGGLSDAELRGLLLDCLTLWGVQGRVEAAEDGLAVIVEGQRFLVRRAEPELRPVRWFLQTPERETAGRPARAVPATGALLTALRNAMGAAPGNRLRIGAG
jgi:hypothetical protein